MAKPWKDEVVVYQDFFIMGLQFPMDPVLVDILQLYSIYTHLFASNSFVRLNLYFWLTKTYRLHPTAKALPMPIVYTAS